MLTVKVQGLGSVNAYLSGLQSELERGQAISMAINRTASKAQTEINRAIRDEFLVKPDEVRNSITIRRASRNQHQAIISIFGSRSKRGRSLNMIRFLAAVQGAGGAVKTRGATGAGKKALKQLCKQLGFAIRKGGGLKQIHGAFVGNKGRTIFIREGKARLPIRHVQVIGFGQMFNTRRISERVMDKVRSDLVIETQRAIKAVIARRTA